MRFDGRSVKHITILYRTTGAHCNMKFIICALALVAAASAAPPAYDPAYNPQIITKDGLARIIKYEQDQKDDGTYHWSYDTENGISAAETNVPKIAGNGEPSTNVEGGYRYTAPDGQVVEATYKAGEEGFVVQGTHIPTPHPIPEEILRGLAWNAAHPEEEAQWDAIYNNKPVPQPIYPAGK